MNDQTLPMNEADTLKMWSTIATDVNNLLVATNEKGLDDYFERFRADAEAQVAIKGIRLSNADEILTDVERRHCEVLDKDYQSVAKSIDEQLIALERALDAQERVAGTLVPPQPNGYGDRMLHSMAQNLERQELRALAKTWTIDRLTAYYGTLTDAQSPALVAFIEAEAAENFPSIELRPDDGDAVAVKKLTQLMHERRAARVPIHVKEVRLRLSASLPMAKRMLIKEIARANSRVVSNQRFRGATRVTKKKDV